MEQFYLKREDIKENVIAIKINRSYRKNMSGVALYDITRGYWKLNLQRAEQAEYAFSVYRGIVKEVYKIDKWLPAGSTTRPTLPDAEIPADRYEFIGQVAEDKIREQYIGKSIANLYQRGNANPINYFLL